MYNNYIIILFVKYDERDMYNTKYVTIMYKTYRIIHRRAEILNFSLSEIIELNMRSMK